MGIYYVYFFHKYFDVNFFPGKTLSVFQCPSMFQRNTLNVFMKMIFSESTIIYLQNAVCFSLPG